MGLADSVDGRTAIFYVYVRLTPPLAGAVGKTDAAMEIGNGLVSEVLRMLRAAAEAEGFEVKIEIRQVVY